jgi:hypothetical protein
MGHSRNLSKNQSTAGQQRGFSHTTENVTQRMLNLFTDGDQNGDNLNTIRNLRKHALVDEMCLARPLQCYANKFGGPTGSPG